MKNRLKIFEEKGKFFRKLSFFNEESGEEILQDFKLKIIHKNQDLYKQNDKSEYIYIIKSGNFKVIFK